MYKFLNTYGPPAGILDFTVYGKRAGRASLLVEISERIKPQLHLFDHIHEGHGIRRMDQIIFVSGSICNPDYLPIHAPLVLKTS
jgi:Icc-related predicted phosphoesterase